jgi:hypothetical protein
MAEREDLEICLWHDYPPWNPIWWPNVKLSKCAYGMISHLEIPFRELHVRPLCGRHKLRSVKTERIRDIVGV